MIVTGGSWSVIHRHEFSDAEWDLLRPVLPTSSTGRPRLDDRTVLNGIVWKFRTLLMWVRSSAPVPSRPGGGANPGG
ncbi:transposase [Kitasatospora purpeofusca]|uniref:transposase n=1 Tax=Kitasatospora purpeofusca TaxID=67352 RepID=UPI0035DEB5EE